MRKDIQDIELSIRRISEKAAEKEECVRLDIGQPSFETPQHVKEAAVEGLENKQGYSPMLGVEELREAIADEEKTKNDIEPKNITSDNVMVTTGGMGALYSVFTAMLDDKDKAVFNDPCWGPYKMISAVNGNKFEQVQYWDEDGELREDAKEKIKEAELVVINTPQNPTGNCLTQEQAEEFGQLCDRYGTFLVSDEVYHRLTFGQEHYSPASYTDKSVMIGSVSKNHAMTGWRVGWIVGKQKHLEQFAKVARTSTACPPTISQYAAVNALEDDSHVKEMKEEYEERKTLAVQRMEELGWEVDEPEGAIYAFPDAGRDSWELCLEMVEKGVAMVPGEPMGPESDTCVRICFGSVTKDEINRAFDILEEELG